MLFSFRTTTCTYRGHELLSIFLVGLWSVSQSASHFPPGQKLPWTTFEDLQLSDKKSDLRSKSNIYPMYQDIQTWVTALRLQLGQPHQTQNDV